MTDKLRDAAQQALEVLVQIHPGNMTPMAEEAWNKSIVMLGAALAEQADDARCRELLEAFDDAPKSAEQEPVAWPHKWGCRANAFGECNMGCTAPQPAKREPLTDEEMGKIINANWGVGVWEMARAIIAAYERKNGIGGQA